MTDHRKLLPSVDKVLNYDGIPEMISGFGRPLVIDAIRHVMNQLRRQAGSNDEIWGEPETVRRISEICTQWTESSLVPVINATGVILHTNLGRAPLSTLALEAIKYTSLDYSNLEYSINKGERGSRYEHASVLLTRLTGAEAALVVNNNAAAIYLCLTALAKRKRVIISRTQLVEIGGGFRIPDIMSQSGARLVEVGTTNRVSLSDFETEMAEPTGMILQVHSSNFRIIGYTGEPSLEALVQLGHKHHVPVMHDLGSGTLIDTARFGLAHEPTIQESIKSGVDIVCVSGDKLLGGPQCGIILGRENLIDIIRRHPVTRVVRPDKLCLAALSATLSSYLKNKADLEIPIWQMISAKPSKLRQRAMNWRNQLNYGSVASSKSTIGGGSMPAEMMDTYVLCLKTTQANQLLNRLRSASPPVIARIEDDNVIIDPRTVLPHQEEILMKILKHYLAG